MGSYNFDYSLVTGTAGEGKTNELVKRALLSSVETGLLSVIVSVEEFPATMAARAEKILKRIGGKKINTKMKYLYQQQFIRGRKRILEDLCEQGSYHLFIDSNIGFDERRTTLLPIIEKAESVTFTQLVKCSNDLRGLPSA